MDDLCPPFWHFSRFFDFFFPLSSLLSSFFLLFLLLLLLLLLHVADCRLLPLVVAIL